MEKRKEVAGGQENLTSRQALLLCECDLSLLWKVGLQDKPQITHALM